MRKQLFGSCLAVFLFCLPGLAKASLYDSFTDPTLDPAWVTRGNPPASIDLNDGHLNLHVAGPMGLTPMGIQREATFAAPWAYSVDVFHNYDASSENIVSIDVGVEAGGVTRAMRLSNYSPTAPTDPNAPDRVVEISVLVGSDWIPTAYPSMVDFGRDEAHTFMITSAGGFYVDGNLAFSMSSLSWNLDRIYIETGNFADEAQGTEPNHFVSLDNVLVTPEPATAVLLGLTSLVIVRRRRSLA
jgi:hypothetical protein